MENVTFRKWAEEWMKEKRQTVKESTYANYSVIMANHLLPVLGERQLLDISRKDVQNLVMQWTRDGRIRESGGLSLKSVRDITGVLMRCLKDADQEKNRYDWKIIYPNKREIEEIQIMSIEETSKLLQIAWQDKQPEHIGYALCICTGIRIGELCALQWKDIDLKERTISVKKTLQRIYIKDMNGRGHSKIIISPPKSQKSRRIIPVAGKMCEILSEIKQQKETYLLTGREEFIEPRVCRKNFKEFMQENKLPDIRFHALRHTFATQCIAMGTDYKTVSELMGHASVSFTMNFYVHAQMEEKRKCVEALERLYL